MIRAVRSLVWIVLVSACSSSAAESPPADAAVDSALDASAESALDVTGAWAPGVAVATSAVAGQRFTCVTKAGGFGAPELFVSLLHAGSPPAGALR